MLSYGTSEASGDDGDEARVVGNPVGSLETSPDDSLNDNNEKSLGDSFDLWEVKGGDSACKSDSFLGSPADNKPFSLLVPSLPEERFSSMVVPRIFLLPSIGGGGWSLASLLTVASRCCCLILRISQASSSSCFL